MQSGSSSGIFGPPELGFLKPLNTPTHGTKTLPIGTRYLSHFKFQVTLIAHNTKLKSHISLSIEVQLAFALKRSMQAVVEMILRSFEFNDSVCLLITAVC